MRKIALLAAPLVLAACGSEPAEEEVIQEDVVVEEPAPAGVTANGSPAGTYSSMGDDGNLVVHTLNEDGTYMDASEDGTVLEEGSFAVVDGQICFTSSAEGAEQACYTESERAPDGSFTVTPLDGEPFTVTPYVAADAAAAG